MLYNKYTSNLPQSVFLGGKNENKNQSKVFK